MIRERWPNVDILLRGDSGFARENLMRWCEGNAVDYVFGLARNEVLLKKARSARSRAAMAMIETGQPVRAYGEGLSDSLCLGRFSDINETLTEDDGELCLGLGPFTRRAFPSLGRMIEPQI